MLLLSTIEIDDEVVGIDGRVTVAWCVAIWRFVEVLALADFAGSLLAIPFILHLRYGAESFNLLIVYASVLLSFTIYGKNMFILHRFRYARVQIGTIDRTHARL